jgi:hypothetical protein
LGTIAPLAIVRLRFIVAAMATIVAFALEALVVSRGDRRRSK